MPLLFPGQAPEPAGRQEEHALPGLCLRRRVRTSGTAGNSPLRRAFDLCLFAPVGIAVTVVEDLPELIAKGRRKVELQLGNAHVVGRFVVNKSQRGVSHRLDGLLGSGTEPTSPGDEDGSETVAQAAWERRVPDPAAEAIVGECAGRLRHAQRLPGRPASREPGPGRAARRPALRGLHPQPAHDLEPGRPAPRGAAHGPVRRLGAWSWPGRPVAADRQACTRLLSQALVAAASMRGGCRPGR